MNNVLLTKYDLRQRKVILEGGDSGSFGRSYVLSYKLPIRDTTTQIISTYTFDLIYILRNAQLTTVSTTSPVVQHMDFVPYPLERPVSILVSDGRIFTDRKLLESPDRRYNQLLHLFLEEIDYKNHSFRTLYKTAGGVYA